MKNCSNLLRKDLLGLAENYVSSHGLESHVYRSLGNPPTVLFRDYTEGGSQRHGNFHPESYDRIVDNKVWSQRLGKAHSQKSRALDPVHRDAAKELDSCTSSDALLMNVLCHHSATKNPALAGLFGLDRLPMPSFGYRPSLLLANGKNEPRSTEIDLDLRSEDGTRVLAEAKLTEKGFTNCSKSTISRYEHFNEVFDAERLPKTADAYLHYQLLRNVLAAREPNCSFVLIHDNRRPDLGNSWQAVAAAIRCPDLASRCWSITWQQIAAVSDPSLREFLAGKYGIL